MLSAVSPPLFPALSVNVYTSPKMDRPLTTGLHTVSDLYCAECDTEVGWFYNHAYELSQKYKENKFILIENKIVQDEDDALRAAQQQQQQQQQQQAGTAAPAAAAAASTAAAAATAAAPPPSAAVEYHTHGLAHHAALHRLHGTGAGAMEEEDDDDAEDDDEDEEGESGGGAVGRGGGVGMPPALLGLSPVMWNELSSILGQDAPHHTAHLQGSAEGGASRRRIDPAEMRVRLRPARAGPAALGHL